MFPFCATVPLPFEVCLFTPRLNLHMHIMTSIQQATCFAVKITVRRQCDKEKKKQFFYCSVIILADLMPCFQKHLLYVWASIDSSLSATHKEKRNYYVFVYNSPLAICSLFQGDKRTQVRSSSEEGDVWSNVKAVLIFLNCVCSVCHY